MAGRDGITQLPIFSRWANIDVRPVAAEITYGVERLAMFIQGVTVCLIRSGWGYSYGDVFTRQS